MGSRAARAQERLASCSAAKPSPSPPPLSLRRNLTGAHAAVVSGHRSTACRRDPARSSSPRARFGEAPHEAAAAVLVPKCIGRRACQRASAQAEEPSGNSATGLRVRSSPAQLPRPPLTNSDSSRYAPRPLSIPCGRSRSPTLRTAKIDTGHRSEVTHPVHCAARVPSARPYTDRRWQ